MTDRYVGNGDAPDNLNFPQIGNNFVGYQAGWIPDWAEYLTKYSAFGRNL